MPTTLAIDPGAVKDQMDQLTRQQGRRDLSRGNAVFSIVQILLEENLHVVEVKGHGVRLEKFMPNHAREKEAERIFPRKWAIKESLNMLFLHFAKGNSLHNVGHDSQSSSASRACFSLIFFEHDPG
jgi:hypothetical protein